MIAKTNKPTRRQQQVLDCIKASIEKNGFPPSIREIGETVGLSSSSTVHTHLISLERKKHLKRNPSKPRSITLCDPGPSLESKVFALLSQWAETFSCNELASDSLALLAEYAGRKR